MQGSDTSVVDIYVAYGQRRCNAALHWLLLLAYPDSDHCTWYHAVGGPSQGRPYERKIEANKRVESLGISSKQWVSRIPASEVGKVKAAAQAVSAQRCQCYVVEVLAILERKNLVPAGTSAHYHGKMEPVGEGESGSAPEGSQAA